MRGPVGLALACCLLASPSHAAGQDLSPVNAGHDLAPASRTITIVSARKVFCVTLTDRPERIPLARSQTWRVHISDSAGRPLKQGVVLASGGMPQHGHGMPTAPVVTRVAAGEYRIDGLRFHMPGYWELSLNIRSGTARDVATIGFEVQ